MIIGRRALSVLLLKVTKMRHVSPPTLLPGSAISACITNTYLGFCIPSCCVVWGLYYARRIKRPCIINLPIIYSVCRAVFNADSEVIFSIVQTWHTIKSALKFQKVVFFIILIFLRENTEPSFFIFRVFGLKQTFFSQDY